MPLLKLGKWALPAFLVAIALGVLISVQFQLQKRVNQAKEVNYQKIAAVNKMVDRAKEQKQSLEKQQAELEQKVKTYRNAQVSPEVKDKIDTLGILSGETPVEGPGIHIEIDDRKVTGPYIVTDHLLSIVNTLRYAGAEAIEVNGQRIGPRSFSTFSGPIVVVNGVPIARVDQTHWEVEAIGNQEVLRNYVQTVAIDPLLAENAFPDLKVTVTAQVVKIPRLKSSVDFVVAKLVE